RPDRILARDEPERSFLPWRQAAIRFAETGDEAAQGLVEIDERLLRLGTVRSGLLPSVIEMRQIDVEEIRPLAPRQMQRRIDDPGRRFDVCHGTPKMLERKMPQRVAQLAIQLRRPRVAP